MSKTKWHFQAGVCLFSVFSMLTGAVSSGHVNTDRNTVRVNMERMYETHVKPWAGNEASDGTSTGPQQQYPTHQSDIQWLNTQAEVSNQRLLSNISPIGASAGAVIASPSKQSPNYYYHWIRDAALTMNVVVSQFEKTVPSDSRDQLSLLLSDYVNFSRGNQTTTNRSGGLGEPKFNVDGSAFNGDWGRPQNDGPALRAITLIRYANALLAISQTAHTPNTSPEYLWVKSNLYDCTYPTNSPIKTDLEFISNHWQESSFDLWEETRGQHFYTKIVQRRALLAGADLADALVDPGASSWYRYQAGLIQAEIEKHWNPDKGYIEATLNRDGGISTKVSGLDTGVILGVLHGIGKDDFFAPADDRVLATAYAIRNSFQNLYKINQDSNLPPAIGRYPEDQYNGYTNATQGGNPWVLTTCAFSELYSRVARSWVKTGSIQVTTRNQPFLTSLASKRPKAIPPQSGQIYLKGSPVFDFLLQSIQEDADGFLMSIRLHTPSNGVFFEEINRDSGMMQGAIDLTWSYTGFLTAYWSRLPSGQLSFSDFMSSKRALRE